MCILHQRSTSPNGTDLDGRSPSALHDGVLDDTGTGGEAAEVRANGFGVATLPERRRWRAVH